MREQLYEMIVIFDSQKDDSEIHRECDLVQSLVEKRSTEFVGRTDWGLRNFAYPIKKRESGYYVYYLFKGGASVPAQLALALKMDENVLRHLIIRAKNNATNYLAKTQDIETERLAKKLSESEIPVDDEVATEEPEPYTGEEPQEELSQTEVTVESSDEVTEPPTASQEDTQSPVSDAPDEDENPEIPPEEDGEEPPMETETQEESPTAIDDDKNPDEINNDSAEE